MYWLKHHKKFFLFFIKAFISCGIIFILTKRSGLNIKLLISQKIDPIMGLMAIVFMVFQLVLGAMRWGMVIKALSGRMSWMKTFSGYYAGNFFSQVLPGAIAGDIVRIWASQRTGLSFNLSVYSVLLERGITVLGLVILVVITQPFLLQEVPNLPGRWVFPSILFVSLLGLGSICLLDRLPAHWSQWKIIRGFFALSSHTKQLFFKSFLGAGSLILAIISQINLSLVAWFLAMGLGINVSVLDCLVLVPPVILLMVAPISIAGWGVREMAMVSAFGFVGVPEDRALLLSIFFGITSLVASLPGGLFLLFSKDVQKPKPTEVLVDGKPERP